MSSGASRRSPSGRPSWSTGAVRSAAHGGTRRQRCRTSTSCSRPPGPCSAPRRALPRRRAAGDGAAALARGVALPRARDPRARRGGGGRPPAGRVPPLARRAPARPRPRAVARPVHLPAREPASLELRRLAVRARLLAARCALRPRARMEPVPAADLPGRRRFRLPLAPGARAARGCGGTPRARLRARTLPRRAEHGASARANLRALGSGALGAGTRTARLAMVVRGRRRCAGLDPVLGRAPRARGDSLLPALRTLPRRLARRRAGDRGGARVRPARRALLDDGDRRRRALAARGLALLGERARLRPAPPPARARELRLPPLADGLSRPGRAGRARAGAALVARRGARRRGARAVAARARNALPALLDPVAPPAAAALPARARAAAARRLPGASGAGRLRRGAPALGARGGAAR